MKRPVIALLLFLPGCATLLKEPDWKFDCQRARLYDLLNNAHNRTAGLSFTSQLSKFYCEEDPTSPDYYGQRK